MQWTRRWGRTLADVGGGVLVVLVLFALQAMQQILEAL